MPGTNTEPSRPGNFVEAALCSDLSDLMRGCPAQCAGGQRFVCRALPAFAGTKRSPHYHHKIELPSPIVLATKPYRTCRVENVFVLEKLIRLPLCAEGLQWLPNDLLCSEPPVFVCYPTSYQWFSLGFCTNNFFSQYSII